MKITNGKFKGYYVYLPDELYKRAKELILPQNINIDFLIILLHLIYQKSIENKKIENNGYIRLYSSYLRGLDFRENGIYYRYNEHIEFLKENKIIELIDHSISKSESRGFRIHSDIFQKNKQTEKVYLQSNKIKTKLEKRINTRKNEVRTELPHLSKWLDDESNKLQIDEVNALKFIKREYSNHDSKEYKHREMFIKEFEMNKTTFSRDGKDNRLHTVMSRLPKDLKPFVTFDNIPIVEIDIKNSQPFILGYLILNSILKNNETSFSKLIFRKINNPIKTKYYNKKINKNYRINIKYINNISISLQNISSELNFTELIGYIDLVKCKQIYETISEKLYEKGIIKDVLSTNRNNSSFSVNLFDKKEKRIIEKYFQSKRDAAKKITLNALYSKPKPKKENDTIKGFFSLIPSVYKFVNAFKQDDYKLFSILMQRIEAKAMLDNVTKKIAKNHPEMLLFTRHDSICTTIDFKDILEKEMQLYLNEYFEMHVNIDKEFWNKEKEFDLIAC